MTGDRWELATDRSVRGVHPSLLSVGVRMDEPAREIEVRGVEHHRVEIRVAQHQMAASAQHACDLFQEGVLVR